MSEIILIIHNIRSTHNVGSLFRTAECLGIKQIILSGYSPYPKQANDKRLPHIYEKINNQIHKTALGAENMVPFIYQENLDLTRLKREGYRIVGLENGGRSASIEGYTPPEKIALVLGEEVNGIDQDIIKQCDDILEIPMKGKKESFNVSVAAGIALYCLSR